MKYTPEIELYFKENWDKCYFFNALCGNNGDIPTEITCATFESLIEFLEREREKNGESANRYDIKSDSLLIFHKKYAHLLKDLCTYKNDRVAGINIVYPSLGDEYFHKSNQSSLGAAVVYIYLIELQEGKDTPEMRCIRFTR